VFIVHPLCQGQGLIQSENRKKEMWFWILVKGVLLHRAKVPAKQQRFHFIDVHASWKCSYYYYYYYH
jgi:hypothetical protein